MVSFTGDDMRIYDVIEKKAAHHELTKEELQFFVGALQRKGAGLSGRGTDYGDVSERNVGPGNCGSDRCDGRLRGTY